MKRKSCIDFCSVVNYLNIFRTWTGKKQLANITTTATSILAAFRRARSWPIVLAFADAPDRKSVYHFVDIFQVDVKQNQGEKKKNKKMHF